MLGIYGIFQLGASGLTSLLSSYFMQTPFSLWHDGGYDPSSGLAELHPGAF